MCTDEVFVSAHLKLRCAHLDEIGIWNNMQLEVYTSVYLHSACICGICVRGGFVAATANTMCLRNGPLADWDWRHYLTKRMTPKWRQFVAQLCVTHYIAPTHYIVQ